MRSHLMEFTERKLRLPSRLDAGEEGGSYGDGILIISSVLSACASQLWSGRGIDKERFVELWARYANADARPLLISVPLLLQALREEAFGCGTAAEALAGSSQKV